MNIRIVFCMLGRYWFWDKIVGDFGRSNEDEVILYCVVFWVGYYVI